MYFRIQGDLEQKKWNQGLSQSEGEGVPSLDARV